MLSFEAARSFGFWLIKRAARFDWKQRYNCSLLLRLRLFLCLYLELLHELFQRSETGFEVIVFRLQLFHSLNGQQRQFAVIDCLKALFIGRHQFGQNSLDFLSDQAKRFFRAEMLVGEFSGTPEKVDGLQLGYFG